MGRIGDFFYHLIIVILVAAALVFLLMAFKEQYPIWKNQQELENLRSKVEKKKTGEYFVYASGGAQSNFGDCYGGHDCSGEKFIPMSVEQAQQWSEEYLTVEKYVEIWGEPEE